jgi:LacI family transcriptional regulator
MVHVMRAKRKVLVAATTTDQPQLRALADYARGHGWHLVTDMLFTGAFPHGWRGDGILALSNYDSPLIADVRNARLPAVVVTRTSEPMPLARVEDDHHAIGRMAADHLLSRDYRSFAWAPLIDDRSNRDTHRGYQSRLGEQGLTCHVLSTPHLRQGPAWQWRWTDYRRRIVGEIQRLPRPTAIFAFTDAVAAAVIDACRDLGVAVPEELAVLGVGNDALTSAVLPLPVSSVEPDYEAKARRAGELLDAMMAGELVLPDAVRVAPRGVITRVSTDLRAVSDPRVARALSFIAENYPNPLLSVADIAAAVGVSRRQLERSFRETAHCTIREQIVRTRMQEAARLLTAHPRAKSADIAALVGLAGAGNFFRTFRRFYGMTPRDHREHAAVTTVSHADAIAGPQRVDIECATEVPA